MSATTPPTKLEPKQASSALSAKLEPDEDSEVEKLANGGEEKRLVSFYNPLSSLSAKLEPDESEEKRLPRLVRFFASTDPWADQFPFQQWENK